MTNENDKIDQEEELIIVENKKDLVDDEDDDDHDSGEDRDKTEDKALKENDEDETKDSDDSVLASRREERRRRKERKDKAIQRDRSELEYHRKRNSDLEQRLSRVEVSSQESQLSQIDQAIAKASNEVGLVERIMAKAVTANNGEDLVKATKIRDQAMARVNQLYHLKNQATQQVQRPNNTTLDDESATHARNFISDHKWYDPKGGGEDSGIVLAIDASLVREGFDSKTPEYWDELRDRVKKRLPERFSGDKSLQNDQKTERRQQGGPALGSGRNTSTSAKQVYISPERKQAMVDAGIWDDPILRKRMVKQYQKYDQEAKSRN